MCMIIYRPKGAKGEVTRARMNYIAHKNPDGFGLMWALNGKLVTARYDVKQKKPFIDRFLSLQKDNVVVCAHFRWSTHGTISRGNTHPFHIVEGESALMHNGVFNITTEKNWSDTRTFVELVLKRLPADWLQDKEAPYRYLISQATYGSKMAIMQRNGDVTLIHEKAGTWENEIWYSNSQFESAIVIVNDKDKDKDKAREAAEDIRKEIDEQNQKAWAKWKGWSKQDSRGRSTYRQPYDNGHYRGYYSSDQAHSPTPPQGLGQKLKKAWHGERDGEVESLYFWEGMIMCEACKRMEATCEKEAVEITGLTSDDVCELCGAIGKPADTGQRLIGSGEDKRSDTRPIGYGHHIGEQNGDGAGNCHDAGGQII